MGWVDSLFLLAVLFWISCLTWLFPCVAAMRWRASPDRAPPGVPWEDLEILIPAHNESESIGRTIASIRAAMAQVARLTPDRQLSPIRIRVGADACTDRTVGVCRELEVEVCEYPDHRSKWRTLEALIRSSAADWVCFVDADASWSRDLLSRLAQTAWPLKVIGIAPPFGRGAHWGLERALKSLENHAGGPVSVHGATVFYRRSALITALDWLKATAPQEVLQVHWLNDDVVIPLALRASHPEGELVYWVQGPMVSERARSGEERLATSGAREARVAFGNAQWAVMLWPAVWRRSPRVAVLALRRVLRAFWAYGALISVGGCLWLWGSSSGIQAVIPQTIAGLSGAVFLLHPRARSLLLASLRVPWFFARLRSGGTLSWR